MFLLRSFYSLQDTKTPMYTNLGASLVRIGLYAGLTTGVGAFAGFGLKGIPIADAVVYTLHFVALATILRTRVGGIGAGAVFSSLARILAASAIGGVVAWQAASLAEPLATSTAGFLAQLLLSGVLGLIASYALAVALRVPEVAYVRRVVGRVATRMVPGGDEP
jgi:peptidoglycan biosynthesis protein MviN/MurJ (putative lipid II flippase)